MLIGLLYLHVYVLYTAGKLIFKMQATE